MPYISDFEYYDNESNHGSYQYVSLKDIVNNFMLMYTGNHSVINNEERYKVIFHAKRAIQELNYDAFKAKRTLELNVCEKLIYVLPSDFVNWIRISLYKDGVLFPMNENIQAMSSEAYLQDNNCNILFDEAGNILKPENSQLDYDRLKGKQKSLYLNEGTPYHGREGWFIDGSWYFDYTIGGRFGMNTGTANSNPLFEVDRRSGVINFSSEVAGELVVLEYITDGMENGDETLIMVNKMFESYIYAYIKYEIIKDKFNIPMNQKMDSKRERTALLRNARIRMMKLRGQDMLMVLRNQNKWIK